MLHLRRHSAAALALTLFALSSFAALCAEAAETPNLSLELNKVEASETGCRVYLVADNQSEIMLATLRLDLVFFQTDGVIGKRVALDLAPVKAKKRVVKAFDIDKLKCDGIGSILINEIADCRSDSGPLENCLGHMSLKSLSTVQLTK